MAVNRDELLALARADVDEIFPDELRALMDAGAPVTVLDVREQSETDEGIIAGSLLIPRGSLELRVEEAVPRTREVVILCAVGVRSLLAGQTLRHMGYAKVRSLAGGFARWKMAGHPWVRPQGLDANKRRRYSRHLLMPEVGEAGQAKLLQAKVLLVGAGGLGSPSALYLGAAGVGTLGIVDDDVVDESNLQRQVIHTTDRVGRPKTESARVALQGLNPGVQVVEHRLRLNRENALQIMAEYDLVLDGTDNFATRYLVNDACALLKKPNVHGSVFRFDGQATTFIPGAGPCYRCLFPEPPPPELAPSCQEAGVLGVLPGIIGLLQAIEAVKVILGIGRPLVGRLLAYDALEQSFREMRYKRDPRCPACGEQPMSELPEYRDATCAAPVRRSA